MPFERPTFHESWYRVSELHPRLRSTVQITRQHYRGQPWHVVQDHTNNAFFRLSEPAYRLLGMLDGQRSVGEAWRICNEQLGDDAPTQGETIQLLGQLYTSNLLQAEMPADSHGLFNRYKKRVRREVQNYLMNLMFIRIPLLDPDRFLERWMPLFGWIFSFAGLVVWLALMGLAFFVMSGRPGWTTDLFSASQRVMDPGNLLLLYVGFALIKTCHEFGHAISCKRFGLRSGVGGEVHTMGIMFLIFSPVPYVDASSSWALRSKWQRVIVGAAGMWVELAIASIAAIVWAKTGDTATVHQLAYNMMFVASVSTVLFNANPLLRYDGYYMLSDFLEIPNLAQRAKDYIYYLVKRYIWGIKQARNPSHSGGERFWLFNYAWASFLMRIAVSFGIMFYLASVLDGALIIIAAAMGLAGLVTWVLVPIGRFVHYLATSHELTRVRPRAVATTLLFVALVATGVGLIPAPDHARAEGVVETEAGRVFELNGQESGFIKTLFPVASVDPQYGVPTVAANQPLFQGENIKLETELQAAEATLLEYRTKRDLARASSTSQEPRNAEVELWQDQVDKQAELIQKKKEALERLRLQSPLSGVLIAPQLEQAQGAYVPRGGRIGLVADLDLDHLIVRAVAPNEIGGPLHDEAGREVEIRVKGRPDILLKGTIEKILPAGQHELPSPALGYNAGGQTAVSSDDRRGVKTTQDFFEIHIHHLEFSHPSDGSGRILPGQRVIVRFDLVGKPLAKQAWTALLQMIQKRFSR